MNLLICIETLNTGGAETFVRNLIKESASRKTINAYLFITNPQRNHFGDDSLFGVKVFHPKNLSEYWCAKYIASLVGRDNFLNEIQYIYQFLFFNYILIFFNISHVNSHLFKTDFKISKYNRILKREWSLVMHGCYEDCLFNNLGDIDHGNLVFFNQIFKLVNSVYYPANKNLECFSYTNVIPRLKKIDYGLFPFVDNGSTELFGFSNCLVLGMVSRGIPEKGWELGISSFLEFQKRYNVDCKLILVFSETEFMNSLRIKYQDYENIIFFGHCLDARQLMKGFDLLLFPSFFKSESQPLTIVEALQAGLPVLATDIGDIPNMLSRGNLKCGISVSYSQFLNSSYIADVIYKLVTDDCLLKKFRVDAKLISEDFSISRVFDIIFRK